MKKFICLLFSFVLTMAVMAQHRQDRFTVADTATSCRVVRMDESVARVLPQSSQDSLEISLITCSPGEEAYTMFGHTAIRVVNRNEPGMDFVFNYGMFNYNSKNFIYRFLKGETDYELGVEEGKNFFRRYTEHGYTVWEQKIRLNTKQKAEILHKLIENYRPENRVYRYNFLYDNCTTRARKIIMSSMGDSSLDWSMFPTIPANSTYRSLLHMYTKNSPWTEFGIDMLLGSEVDQPVTVMTCSFLPVVYKQLLDSTLVHFPRPEYVTGTHDTQYIVSSVREYDPTGQIEQVPGFPLSPMALFTLLLVIALVLSGWNFHTCHLSWWFDAILYLSQGLAGVLITFLFFFSEHPAVGSNWLVLSFNPLALLLIPNVIAQRRKDGCPLVPFYGVDLLECVNMTCLLITLFIFFAPIQCMNPAVLPLVSTLLVRSLLHFVHRTRQMYNAKRKKHEQIWNRR